MSGADGATAAAPAQRRLPVVDMARGFALVAMFAYHLTWDFAHFGYIDAHTPFLPQMRLFSHAIASSFLFIAGASLVLARKSPFDWRAYGKRMALVVAAAAAVTAASWVAAPGAVIFFGILHCIAAASLLALPFLFLPWPAALAAAVVAAAAPFLIESAAFDGPALVWTGLGSVDPTSNDFRPLLPWAAALLAGVGFADFWTRRGGVEFLARAPGTSRPARALAFGGRHSLIVYLVHQPLFYAAFLAVAWAFGPPGGPADERPFRARCEIQCQASGAPDALCARACGCTAHDIKRLGLWDKLTNRRLDPAETSLLSRVARECVARERGGN